MLTLYYLSIRLIESDRGRKVLSCLLFLFLLVLQSEISLAPRAISRAIPQATTSSEIQILHCNSFNVVVELVVRAVLDLVCGPQEAKHGLGWAAGERNVIFYADDVRIAGRYHEWVQDALLVTVEMFRSMGLKKNINNSKTMVCTTGFIWG